MFYLKYRPRTLSELDNTSVKDILYKHLDSEKDIQKSDIEEIKESLSTIEKDLEEIKQFISFFSARMDKRMFKQLSKHD